MWKKNGNLTIAGCRSPYHMMTRSNQETKLVSRIEYIHWYKKKERPKQYHTQKTSFIYTTVEEIYTSKINHTTIKAMKLI
jgi:hypothetical protein